jgi:hypothetical protein
MRTITVAICAALVGALIGAWVVHLSEGNARLAAQLTSLNTEKTAQLVELGKRLNLCLVEKVEAWEALKAKESEHTLIPGSGKK